MGEDALELKEDKANHCGKERSRNVRSRDLAFSEITWGGVAREFMLSIKKLKDAHWVSIYEHVADFMGRSEQVVDREGHFPGDSESEAVRPRTQIQMDW
jgi:very-short-patch-repair endonuclease